MLMLWCAGFGAFLGALLVYLAAPQQCWLQRSLPQMPALCGALVLAGGAFFGLHTYYSVAVSAFILGLIVMLVWSFLPLILAFYIRKKAA